MFLSVPIIDLIGVPVCADHAAEVTGHAELGDSSSWWSEEDRDTPSSFHALCQAFVAALGLGPCILLLDGINYISSTLGLSQQEVGINSTSLFLCLKLGL